MEQSTENKILIHACCGICSGYPISLLKELGYTPVVYFCNNNLDTREEYEKYLSAVQGLEGEPERGKRCDVCIRQRLLMTAKKAKELGIKKFTTSLVISPHKNFEKISKIGADVADGIEFVPIDFKKKDGFLKTNKLSKELGIYRQNYCGCEFAKQRG